MKKVAMMVVALLCFLPAVVSATEDEHDWILENVIEATAVDDDWEVREEAMATLLEEFRPEEFSEECLQFAYMNEAYVEQMYRTAKHVNEENAYAGSVSLFLAQAIIRSDGFATAAFDCRIGI